MRSLKFTTRSFPWRFIVYFYKICLKKTLIIWDIEVDDNTNSLAVYCALLWQFLIKKILIGWDRLVDDSDRAWFHKHLELTCTTKFGAGFYDVFKHLDRDGKKSVTVSEMRNLIFGDYMTNEDSKPYNEVKEMMELKNIFLNLKLLKKFHETQ